MIPFLQEIAPDSPSLENGGLNGASAQAPFGPINVIPIGNSFKKFGTFTTLTSGAALGGPPLGMFSFKASNGTFYTFFGYSTHLKRYDNGTNWEDVSRTSGGAYATGAGERWRFTSFGDRVIAVNYSDATQVYLAGTDTDFSPLAASAPKARYICTAGEFVVLGYVNDGTAYPFRVQWSALGDPTAAWTPSVSTQADYDDLDSTNGDIIGLVGGENYFLVIQTRAITRYDYVGGDIIFQAQEIVTGAGCQIPGTILEAGGAVFLRAQEGFHRLNGGALTPIGLGRVDRSYAQDLATFGTGGPTYPAITSCKDPTYPVIYFSDDTSGTQQYILAYNYLVDKWALIDLGADYLCIGIIYTTGFPNGVFAAILDSNKRLGHFGDGRATAQHYTKVFTPLPGGGTGVLQRIRVLCDQEVPSSVNVYYTDSASQFLDIQDNSAAFTATGFNNEWTGRVHGATFAVEAIFTGNNQPYPIGVEVLEMRASGRR
jgi:hypothetical protein